MCLVSMVGDYYKDKWNQPHYQEQFAHIDQVSRQEFELLKKEVLEMKELIKKAVEYDKKNNEPHCENPEKVKLLKQIADLFGIELDLSSLETKQIPPPPAPPPARIIKQDTKPRKPHSK